MKYILFLLTFVFFFSKVGRAASLDGYYDPEALRSQYAYLYKEKVHTLPDGSLQFHHGRLFKRDGINVLHLKGDYFETAFQHGALLKQEILDGAITQSSKMISNTVRNALGNDGLLTRIVNRLVDRFLTSKMVQHAMETNPAGKEAFSKSAFALSETTGIPVDSLVDAAFAPDTLMLLAANSMKYGAFPMALGQFIGNCTAFTAWDSYTRDGGMIVGRNLDFPLTHFDKYPTVIYFEPTDGGQKFLSVVSAGIQFLGITAVNESGIYLSLHTLPTPEASTAGMPLFLTGTQILRTARTFDEAANMLKKNPPPTGWTYDLVSTKERRVGSVEMTNEHVEVRESTGGYHVQTNHFLSPEMKDRMLFINHSVDEDSFARYNRSEQLIQQNRGQFDKQTAARILGDQVDPFSGKVRGVGNTVAVHITVTSIVLVPNEKKIYVATGRAPVSHNRYVSFPLPEVFDADVFSKTPSTELAGTGFAKGYPTLARAEQVFLQAKEAYEYRNDAKESLGFMDQVVALDATNPHYHFIRGILALKAGQTDVATQSFSSMLETEPSHHQGNLAHYYLGRIHAADETMSKQALTELALVVDDKASDKKLNGAASKAWLAVKFLGRYALKPESLAVMFQQGDMEHY